MSYKKQTEVQHEEKNTNTKMTDKKIFKNLKRSK